MEILSRNHIINPEQLEPDDLQVLLEPFSKNYRLALTSRMVWEKDIRIFFENIKMLVDMQQNVQLSLIKFRNALISESRLTLENWKLILEREFDIILSHSDPEAIFNPFKASGVIACMTFYKERCIEDIKRIIAIIKPDIEVKSNYSLAGTGFDVSLLSELCLMLEELYNIRLDDGYLLLDDSIFRIAAKITVVVFS